MRVARLVREMSSAAVESSARILHARLRNTLISKLDSDPDQAARFPNRETRAVRRGHFVLVAPTPLDKPYLIAHSEDLAQKLGLGQEHVNDADFLRVFSGNVSQVPGESTHEPAFNAWCTPYAVSVFGQPILSPDQFGGYGYGDGRAASIGEFEGSTPEERWELQLKGSGPSPFSRQFDGRAVLRSSIREFLVSEAMHWLRVPTTRALCLIASESEHVARAWYRKNSGFASDAYPPNHMIRERCAISTRAASSFLRVGQVELYARRIAKGDTGAQEAMRKFVRYCIEREFPLVAKKHFVDGVDPGALPPAAVLDMLREFSKRQANLVSEWLRVGYVQGNMNSDNCLLGGVTMDYGPFGFMEMYDPLWTPFTSDPDRKFGFERQPLAHQVNLATLAEALMPMLDETESEELRGEAIAIVRKSYADDIFAAQGKMHAAKLGLSCEMTEEIGEVLWRPLFKVLQGMDYTIFFRELSKIQAQPSALENETNDSNLVSLVQRAAYDLPLNAEKARALAEWIRLYAKYLGKEKRSTAERLAAMKGQNPKYIPREWMLMEAYEAAEQGDMTVLNNLQSVFKEPYAEQSKETEEKYYRITPPRYRSKPGCSFFSCSS